MNWDDYSFNLCSAVAAKSKCLSRQIGCIITREHTLLSTGYNGPPRGYPHCEGICPRKKQEGYQSGMNLETCPAAHAEQNAIAQAARSGVSVEGATLYLNSCLPCKACMALIINAGIKTVNCSEEGIYDGLGLMMAKQCNIAIIQKGKLKIYSDFMKGE